MGLQIKEILTVAEGILKDAGDEDAKFDAELLLIHASGYDSRKIFMNWSSPLDDVYCEKYFELVQQRANGMPTQYLTGSQAFMGHDFYVDPRVLIPRQDTETLAEAAGDYLKKNRNMKSVLDLCTGSGILAVSLAKEISGLKVTASDIDKEALKVAARNAARHGLTSRVKFVVSDLFVALKKTGFSNAGYDMIVSNPPYIPTDVIGTLQREIVEHEPRHALDGGADGLDFYRRILPEASAYLNKKRGTLFLEVGSDQVDSVSGIALETGRYGEPEVFNDLSGNPRAIRFRVKE